MYFYCKNLCIIILVYVFLLFVHVFLSLSMYSYFCLCILRRGYPTATEDLDFYIIFTIIIGGILVLFIYITRLASNEILSPNKIHLEVGRAKDLSASLYCFIRRTAHSKKSLLGRQDVWLAIYVFVVNSLSPTHFLHLVYLTPSVCVLSNCTTRLERIKQNFSSVFHGKVNLPESSQF